MPAARWPGSRDSCTACRGERGMTAPLLLNGLGMANPYVGQGAYAVRILDGLRRRRPELSVRVLAPASFAALREVVPAEQFVALEGAPPHGHELVAQPYWMRRIARHVGAHFPSSVFHSPSPFWAPTQPACSVVTLHDCIYRSFPKYLGRFLVRRLLLQATERWAARSQLVLTDSVFSADDLAARAGVPREKIRVVYPWVDEASFAAADPARVPALRERLGLPERFWLYVGGYDYRKNVEFLLRAYAGVRRSCPATPPLVLAGRLPPSAAEVYCNVVGTLRAIGLDEEAVRQPGLIPAEDLPDLYRAASLLIYPSLMEGFGLPPAEAMAVGTPVLVADGSSLPEVVRRAECRFDPRDEGSLLERLHAALEDEAQFACPLPAEFREADGLRSYLAALAEVGLSGAGAAPEPPSPEPRASEASHSAGN